MKVLLIEDNGDLADGIRTNLEFEGFAVALCDDGATGLAAAQSAQPDLIILDMMLPNKDGFTVLRELRENGIGCPVLCLTARGEEIDKVRALRGGADDYVTKPFGLMELMARVEALLRRSRPLDTNRLQFGHIAIDPATRVVRSLDQEVSLAPKEYELLLALAEADGAVCSRQQLMRAVWGHSAAVISRTVDTHVAELRRKLEREPAHPERIITVRKAGYRLI